MRYVISPAVFSCLGAKPREDGGLDVPRVQSLLSDDNGGMAGELRMSAREWPEGRTITQPVRKGG